jgi:hypothetical protein
MELYENPFCVRTDWLDEASSRSSLCKCVQNSTLLFRALYKLQRVVYVCARVISSVAWRSGGNATGVQRKVCRTQTEQINLARA